MGWALGNTSGDGEDSKACLLTHGMRSCSLAHFNPITPLRKLKASLIGKFVAIKGTVVRASSVRPIPIQLAFVCNRCGSEVIEKLSEGRLHVLCA